MLLRARFATAATGGGPGGGRMTLNSMYSLRLTLTLTLAPTPTLTPTATPTLARYSLLVELPVGVMPSAEGRGGIDGAYVEHDPRLSYIGCNDAKHGGGKGNDGTEVWTVLSSGDFGKAHKVAQEQLEGTEAETEVTALLLAAVEHAVGLPEGAVAKAASATKLQLWGAAIPMNRWDGGEFAYSAAGRVGIAGDWLSTEATAATASTVEAAWTSGFLLAEHIASDTLCAEDNGLKLGKGGGRFVPVDAGGFGSAALGKSNWIDEPSSGGADAGPPKVFAQRLFVHNLGYEVTEADLVGEIEALTKPRSVAAAQILTGPDGKSRGMAKVRMETVEDAAATVKGLNGKQLWGRALRVNFEEKKSGGGQGRGRGRGGGRGRGAGRGRG